MFLVLINRFKGTIAELLDCIANFVLSVASQKEFCIFLVLINDKIGSGVNVVALANRF